MNQGNGNNAISGQKRRAGSSSGKSPLTPGRDGAGSNKRSSRTTGNSRNSGSSSQTRREDDDNHVPGTNVVRIMRTALPAHAKISDAAKETVQECVTEYISLITSEANERCVREHRKTLTPEDLLYAMAKLGFDECIPPLTLYLNRYREFESQRTSANGEPTVYRTVNYQHLQGPQAPGPLAPPPSPARSIPPPMYPNPHVASPLPPSMYFINPADAMRGFQGFRVAPPAGCTIDIAGPSTSVAYVPAGSSTIVYPYNAAYPPPPPPVDDSSRQFFK